MGLLEAFASHFIPHNTPPLQTSAACDIPFLGGVLQVAIPFHSRTF
jgi:hypothetical protein